MKNDIHHNDIRFPGEEYVPMIVLNSEIPQGHYREYIDSFTNPVVKDMALAEFFFFSGNQEEAFPILTKYLDYPNPYIKITAWLIYSFSNLTLGKKYFNKAYEMAREDGLFEPLGEHHGLLQGLIETCLKKNHKDAYYKCVY